MENLNNFEDQPKVEKFEPIYTIDELEQVEMSDLAAEQKELLHGLNSEMDEYECRSVYAKMCRLAERAAASEENGFDVFMDYFAQHLYETDENGKKLFAANVPEGVRELMMNEKQCWAREGWEMVLSPNVEINMGNFSRVNEHPKLDYLKKAVVDLGTSAGLDEDDQRIEVLKRASVEEIVVRRGVHVEGEDLVEHVSENLKEADVPLKKIEFEGQVNTGPKAISKLLANLGLLESLSFKNLAFVKEGIRRDEEAELLKHFERLRELSVEDFQTIDGDDGFVNSMVFNNFISVCSGLEKLSFSAVRLLEDRNYPDSGFIRTLIDNPQISRLREIRLFDWEQGGWTPQDIQIMSSLSHLKSLRHLDLPSLYYIDEALPIWYTMSGMFRKGSSLAGLESLKVSGNNIVGGVLRNAILGTDLKSLEIVGYVNQQNFPDSTFENIDSLFDERGGTRLEALAFIDVRQSLGDFQALFSSRIMEKVKRFEYKGDSRNRISSDQTDSPAVIQTQEAVMGMLTGESSKCGELVELMIENASLLEQTLVKGFTDEEFKLSKLKRLVIVNSFLNKNADGQTVARLLGEGSTLRGLQRLSIVDNPEGEEAQVEGNIDAKNTLVGLAEAEGFEIPDAMLEMDIRDGLAVRAEELDKLEGLKLGQLRKLKMSGLTVETNEEFRKLARFCANNPQLCIDSESLVEGEINLPVFGTGVVEEFNREFAKKEESQEDVDPEIFDDIRAAIEGVLEIDFSSLEKET